MEREVPTIVREAMSWLGKQERRKTAKVCLVCGRAFSTQGRGLYCSGACRARAFRKKRRRLALGPEEAHE